MPSSCALYDVLLPPSSCHLYFARKCQGSAPLVDEEFFGARLYSGPMYIKYNVALRHEGIVGTQARMLSWARYFFFTAHLADHGVERRALHVAIRQAFSPLVVT